MRFTFGLGKAVLNSGHNGVSNGAPNPIARTATAARSAANRGTNAYAVLAALWMGCSSGSGADDAPSAKATVGSSTNVMPGSGAPPAGGSASAGATAEPKPTAKFAGAWGADFEATKGAVTLDPGVKEKAWTKDDGTAASGNGRIELTVDAEGTVTGKLTGSLGDAVIVGWADDTGLNATFTPPAEAGEGPRMSGTIAVQEQDGKLKGTIRGASGDAKLVRIAGIALVRR